MKTFSHNKQMPMDCAFSLSDCSDAPLFAVAFLHGAVNEKTLNRMIWQAEQKWGEYSPAELWEDARNETTLPNNGKRIAEKESRNKMNLATFQINRYAMRAMRLF